MLEQTLHFLQPLRDYFSKICVSSGFCSLTAWLKERRKPVLDLREDLLCLVPKFGSDLPKGRKAAMSCAAGGEWNKLLIQIWKKKKKKAIFQDILDVFKGLENRRGRGGGEKCCFISCQ